jgi:hypothetical protein
VEGKILQILVHWCPLYDRRVGVQDEKANLESRRAGRWRFLDAGSETWGQCDAASMEFGSMGWGMRGDYNLGIACSGRSLDGTAGLVLGGDRKGRRRLGEAAERKGSSHRWAMVGRKEQGSRSKRMYDERALGLLVGLGPIKPVRGVR